MHTSTIDATAQVEAFRRDGFVRVPGLFSGDELALLQEEAAAQIEAGSARGPARDFMSGTASDGSTVLFRIDAVAAKAVRNDAALLAMVHPEVLRLAHVLTGGPAVCWSDALLWKGPAGGAAVPLHSAHGWHEPHLGHEHLVVDVYVDAATPANGCLHVLPGSHLLSADDNRDRIAAGFDQPGVFPVEMEPGDVLFHSEWMVHGSRATGELGAPTRRILYYAFRHPEVYAPVGASARRDRRMARAYRRMQLAIERRARLERARHETPFDLEVPARWAALLDTVDDSEAYAVGSFHDVGLD